MFFDLINRCFLERCVAKPLGAGLLVVAMASNCVIGETAKEKSQSDAIVSEKDSVELVADSNVGEAISRRPDLSFANVTIDGEATQVSLDSISADSIASVEVMKAVTPDQDADSRGGSISLKSRPAYEQQSISTKISAETTYKSTLGDPGYDLNISIGGPLNESKTWGGRLAIGHQYERDGYQFVSNDWERQTVDGESHLALKEVRFFDSIEWNTIQELNGGLDFHASDELRFYWKGSYRSMDEIRDLPHYEYRINEGEYTEINESRATVVGAQIEQGMYAYVNDREQFENSFGGEWSRGDFEVDFRLKRLTDDYEPTDHLDADFVMSDVDLKYDVSDARFPSITIENGKSYHDASAYRFEDYTGRAGFNAESDSIVSASFKWQNAFGNENLTTGFGLKSRVRDDLVVSESSTYEGYNGADVFSLATVLSEDFAKGIVENRYVLDVKGNKRLMDTFLGENLDLFEYNEQRSRERSDSTSRQVEERVDAIYGMIDYEV